MFFRLVQHLLPDGRAWRPLDRDSGRQLERLLKGLMTGGPERARAFFDSIWAEQFPETTTQLEEWEQELGIFPRTSEAHRRADIAEELAFTDEELDGGQSPGYLQEQLRARGFDVYVHEWWASGPPYVARDPRDYAVRPFIGTVQCGRPAAFCKGFINTGNPPPHHKVPLPGQAQCNGAMASDANYLVNKDFRRQRPPEVPNDPARWPYFIYIGGQTFPTHATVAGDPKAKRDELERLVLKLRPAHCWIVMLVDYVGPSTFDSSFDSSFE